MSPIARMHPAVLVAAVVIAAAALVALAGLVGWLPFPSPQPTPASSASPALGVAGTVPPESLSPGETVVSAPEAPKAPGPQPPRYESGKPPKQELAKPEPAPQEAAKPQTPKFETAQREAPRSETPPPKGRAPAPVTPTYAQRGETTPRRGPCANCGTVFSTAIVEHVDPSRPLAYEVRVRFENGNERALRFPSDPRFRVGDRVRFEGGRLTPEK